MESTFTFNSIIDGQFVFEFSNQEESFRIERPLTEINIFAPTFYLSTNPDVAQSLAETGEEENFGSTNANNGLTFNTTNPNAINLGNSLVDLNLDNLQVFSSNSIDPLRHYVEFGAQEKRDRAPPVSPIAYSI